MVTHALMSYQGFFWLGEAVVITRRKTDQSEFASEKIMDETVPQMDIKCVVLLIYSWCYDIRFPAGGTMNQSCPSWGST